MPNIRQQEKRVRIAARERLQNLRYRSTVKTLTKRLRSAVDDGDADKIAAEHRELVRSIDKAASKGALHRNTAARRKAQAARLLSGGSRYLAAPAVSRPLLPSPSPLATPGSGASRLPPFPPGRVRRRAAPALCSDSRSSPRGPARARHASGSADAPRRCSSAATQPGKSRLRGASYTRTSPALAHAFASAESAFRPSATSASTVAGAGLCR